MHETGAALSTSDTSGKAPSHTDDDLLRAIAGASVADAFREALDAGPALHRHMVRARIVSARMVALQRATRIGFHTASLGEEAAIVGAALAAAASDWIFPGAREWYAALARGMPLESYVHHAYGSAADPAKGHASPDHAPARRWNVVPPSGIAGAHLPQAVGAAWAAQIRERTAGAASAAAVALFGAEVATSGDFHNALNFGGVLKAPIVFVCRSTPLGERVTDRAVAYGIATARVDGSDAVAVLGVVRASLARAHEGRGPTLVEVVSPALDGLASLEDEALASSAVLDLGPADPIVVLGRALAREGLLEAGSAEEVAEEASADLARAIAAAESAGAPPSSTIFDHVYAGIPAHLAAQRQKLTGG